MNSTTLLEKFRQQDSGILSSCGAELQELMHQIDIMVRNKKMEWESQLNQVEDKLEVREQELLHTKSILNQKHKEVALLKNKLDQYEGGQKNVNRQYELNLSHLKNELNQLKHAYANLQKHYQKKGSSIEREKSISKELERVKEHLNKKIENETNFAKQESEWEVQKKVMQHQIECLESQRKSFAEKCERVQQQVLVYQSRLKRSNELVEEVELSSQGLVKKIEAELINDKKLIQRQEQLINELQDKCKELDNLRRLTVGEKYKLQEELDKVSCELRTSADEARVLKSTLSIRDASIRDNKHKSAELRNRLSDLENMLHVKQQLIESLQLRSPKTREADLKRNITHLESLIETYRATEQSLRQENDNLKKDLDYSREQIQTLTKSMKDKETEKLTSVNQEIRHLRSKVEDMEMSHTMELCGMKADVTNISSQLAQKDINIDALGQTCKVINHKLQEETEKRNFLANELTHASENLENMFQNGVTDIGPIKESFAQSLEAAKKDFVMLKQDYQNAVKTLEKENENLRSQVVQVKQEVATLAEMQNNAVNGNSNGGNLHGRNTTNSNNQNFASNVPPMREQQNESIIKEYLEEPSARSETPSQTKEFLKSIGIASSAPSVNTSLYSDSGSKLTINAILGVNNDADDIKHDNEVAEKFMAEEEPRMKDLENKIDSHIKNMQLTMQKTIKKLLTS